MKTIEDHREYLYEVVKLKLHYVWRWAGEHPDQTISDILRERVDIYRKTDINDETMNPRNLHWDDPRWQTLEQGLVDIYNAHREDPAGFEAESFELFKPHVEGRVQIDFEERPYVLDYQCGSLRYDKPRPDAPGRVGFHIANSIQPRSIFEDPLYLPHCLLELINKSRAEHGADALGTMTWLNAHPAWQALFPPEYSTTNRTAEDHNVKWHFGYWGQFLSAKGAFNYKYGQYMRETGEFRYWPSYAWCTFDSLEKHLKGQFPEAF
jgi:hypothetical protein